MDTILENRKSIFDTKKKKEKLQTNSFHRLEIRRGYIQIYGEMHGRKRNRGGGKKQIGRNRISRHESNGWFPSGIRRASHLAGFVPPRGGAMFGRKQRWEGREGGPSGKFAENRGQSRGADEVSLLIHRSPSSSSAPSFRAPIRKPIAERVTHWNRSTDSSLVSCFPPGDFDN